MYPLDKRGGCTWPSEITDLSIPPKSLFVSKEDLYIVKDSITFTLWSSTPETITKGAYYKTANAAIKIVDSNNNLITQSAAGITVYDYWQALTTTNSTPANNSVNWRRVRVYSAYSTSATYYGFNNSAYNTYVLKEDGNSDVLWQIVRTTQTSTHDTVQEGAYWTMGDVCGKKLKSCALRFQATTHGTVTNGVSLTEDTTVPLPFGGFPGAVTYS